MIFYFSGTGNSRLAANIIAEAQGEKLTSIVREVRLNKNTYEYELKEGEKIIFIFPVYAWAPPAMVTEFITKLRFINYKENYISAVALCGENIGNTMKSVEKALGNGNLKLHSGFSIKSPNNYIIMGDVDSKEEEDKKLQGALIALTEINEILAREERNVFKVVKGPIPGILTKIVNPLFNMGAMSLKNFHVSENCTGCRICEKVCNGGCIKVEGKPRWEGKCTQCLACIHHCPLKAIEYGKNTEKKGRYTNPKVKLEEMFVNK